MRSAKKYWFPAKRYGWGWGLPSSWQGWVVLCTFIALVALGYFVFPPDKQLGLYLAYVGALSVLLIAICWLKGEPPRRRWGAMSAPNLSFKSRRLYKLTFVNRLPRNAGNTGFPDCVCSCGLRSMRLAG